MYKTTQRVVMCAAAITAIGLAGCGASASIHVTHTLDNPDKVVAGLIQPRPRSVNCPSGIADKVGTKFTCKFVAADGKKDTVTLLEDHKNEAKAIAIGGKPGGGS